VWWHEDREGARRTRCMCGGTKTGVAATPNRLPEMRCLASQPDLTVQQGACTSAVLHSRHTRGHATCMQGLHACCSLQGRAHTQNGTCACPTPRERLRWAWQHTPCIAHNQRACGGQRIKTMTCIRRTQRNRDKGSMVCRSVSPSSRSGDDGSWDMSEAIGDGATPPFGLRATTKCAPKSFLLNCL